MPHSVAQQTSNLQALLAEVCLKLCCISRAEYNCAGLCLMRIQPNESLLCSIARPCMYPQLLSALSGTRWFYRCVVECSFVLPHALRNHLVAQPNLGAADERCTIWQWPFNHADAAPCCGPTPKWVCILGSQVHVQHMTCCTALHKMLQLGIAMAADLQTRVWGLLCPRHGRHKLQDGTC